MQIDWTTISIFWAVCGAIAAIMLIGWFMKNDPDGDVIPQITTSLMMGLVGGPIALWWIFREYVKG